MKFLCSRTLLYLRIPRNYKSQHLPPLFLQESHFSAQPSKFHSEHHISYPSKRHEDEARNVRVAVWWDFENCGIPAGVNVFRVAQTITAAVRASGMKGPVQITAFGDIQQISRANQEALSSTGIHLNHVPNGGKNSADRSLLVDLFYWVLRNPPPAHLFLISGDRDFARVLHQLRMSNYNILLACREGAPSVLSSAASIMWHWNSMIRGEELTGKLFNQPPDGPYGSWYGHYKGPLEDPFAIPEQPPPVKTEDMSALEPSSELKFRPVPRAVMKSICNILRGNPEGILLAELREELKRRNPDLDKDFYGYRKFSRFLSSMPQILNLNIRSDGQYWARRATRKPSEPSDSIDGLSSELIGGSGELDQRTNVKLKLENEESSSSKDEGPRPEQRIVAEGSSEKAKMQKSTDQNGGKLSQASGTQPPLPEEFVGVNTQASEINLSSAQQQGDKPGFFRRIWRGWSGDSSSDDPNKKSEIDDNFADHLVERKKTEEVVKTVSKDITAVDSESSSVPSKEFSIKEVSEDSQIRGFFQRIVSWFKSWGTSSEPEPIIEQSNQQDLEKMSDHPAKDSIFSQETIWSDVKSFLDSPRGSYAVSQSRNRVHLAKKMRKAGPAFLETLSETDVLHLVDLLISEKQLVKENVSQVFPFRVSQTHFQGSTGLRSIFSDKSFEREGERKGHNISHTGISSPVTCKKPSDRSRDQIIADVQNLVQEVLVQFPDGYNITGFQKLFLEKYGYQLDLQKLGYLKLVGLLQGIPGVSFESGQMVPSSQARQGPSPGTASGARSAASSEEESSDSWEELGPILKERPGRRTKQLDYEPVLLDEEENSSGSDDDLNSLGRGGMKSEHRKSEDEDSSLMQILNTWYSKQGESSNTKALNHEQANGQLYDEPLELPELGRRQKRVYTFVNTDEGGHRKKQIESILGSDAKATGKQEMQQQT